jgi:hypothetical protein
MCSWTDIAVGVDADKNIRPKRVSKLGAFGQVRVQVGSIELCVCAPGHVDETATTVPLQIVLNLQGDRKVNVFLHETVPHRPRVHSAVAWVNDD